MADTTGFRLWHVLLWVPMIAFWAVGGFVLALWGIKRSQAAGLASIGNHAGPFFASKVCPAYNLTVRSMTVDT